MIGPGRVELVAWHEFLRAALDQPPQSPFARAVGGLIVGTHEFVDRIQRMVEHKPDNVEVPQLQQVRYRPELSVIVAVVAAHFRTDPGRWAAGRRSNDAARAVARVLGAPP